MTFVINKIKCIKYIKNTFSEENGWTGQNNTVIIQNVFSENIVVFVSKIILHICICQITYLSWFIHVYNILMEKRQY